MRPKETTMRSQFKGIIIVMIPHVGKSGSQQSVLVGIFRTDSDAYTNISWKGTAITCGSRYTYIIVEVGSVISGGVDTQSFYICIILDKKGEEIKKKS